MDLKKTVENWEELYRSGRMPESWPGDTGLGEAEVWAVAEAISRFGPKVPSMSVLDLGAGDGHLQSRLLLNRTYTGLDSSPTVVARAKAKGRNVLLKVVSDAESLPDADIVTATRFIQNLEKGPERIRLITGLRAKYRHGVISDMTAEALNMMRALRWTVFPKPEDAPDLPPFVPAPFNFPLEDYELRAFAPCTITYPNALYYALSRLHLIDRDMFGPFDLPPLSREGLKAGPALIVW